LTLDRPLRIRHVGDATHVVDGTPTDCVHLALKRLLEKPPDLVFSGVNRGSNVGLDLTYSGTVAAVFEGAIHGIPSIAASIAGAGDVTHPQVEHHLVRLVALVLEHSRDGSGRQPALPALLLNVNLPSGEIRGIRCSAQGRSGFRSEIVEKTDPRGQRYYWIGGQHGGFEEPGDRSDIAALQAGFVSVTPLRLDFTDEGLIGELQRIWRIEHG